MNNTSRESFATVARVMRCEDAHTAKYINVLPVAAQGILQVAVQPSRNVFAALSSFAIFKSYFGDFVREVYWTGLTQPMPHILGAWSSG